MTRGNGGRAKSAKAPSAYGASAAVLVLGLLAALFLVWIFRVGESQGKVSAWADAAMDMRTKASAFHLRFERAVTRGSREEMEKTFSDLDDALALSYAILSAGKSEQGTFLPPIDDPVLRSHGENARAHLVTLKGIGLRRMEDPAGGGDGSSLDGEFDAVVREFDKEARSLEVLAGRRWASDRAEAARIRYVILVVWISIVAASAAGLFRRERRRRHAEPVQERTYGGMKWKATFRTAELSSANRKLWEGIAQRKPAELSLSMSPGGPGRTRWDRVEIFR